MTRKLCAVVAPEAFIPEASEYLDQEFGGQSVLSLTLQAVVAAGVDQIICVGSTDSFLAATKELDIGSPVTVVHLADHRTESHLEVISSYLDSPKDKTDVMVLAGNQPLLNADDIALMMTEHSENSAAVTVAVGGPATVNSIAVLISDAKGRIQQVESLRAAKAFAADEDELTEAYSLYVFAADLLGPAVRRAKPMSTNARVEDLLEVIADSGNNCRPVDMGLRRDQVRGVNCTEDLTDLSVGLQRQKMSELSLAGVQIVNPALTHIDLAVEIGEGARIEPFTTITGNTVIGAGCHIGPFVEVLSSKVEDRSQISHCSVKYGKVANGEIVTALDAGHTT